MVRFVDHDDAYKFFQLFYKSLFCLKRLYRRYDKLTVAEVLYTVPQDTDTTYAFQCR